MDAEVALQELLAAWRETRDPKVADTIERVGAEVVRLAPIEFAGKTLAKKIDAWEAIAKRGRVGDVSAVVAFEYPTGIRNFERVAQGLIGIADDPRVAAKLVELVVTQPVDSIAGRVVTRGVCVRLAQLRDVRGLPALEARVAGLSDWMRGELGVGVAIAALREAVVGAADPALLARHAPRVRDAATEAQFLSEIAANPDDDAAIAVYGDWLAEDGDPRGELIALQLGAARSVDPHGHDAGEDDHARAAAARAHDAGGDGDARGGAAGRAARARVDELVEAHGATWAGELGRLFQEPLVFERGVFAGGLLGREQLDDTQRALPGWELVTRLGLSWSALEGLALPRLVELHVGPGVPEGGDAVLARFPRLAMLALYGAHVDIARWLERAALVEKLACIGLRKPNAAVLGAVVRRRGPRRALLAYTMDRTGWSVTLSRDADTGPFTHVRASRVEGRHGDIDDLVALLAPIDPDPVRELVATATGAVSLRTRETPELEAALTRFANARVAVPWVRPHHLDAAAAPTRREPFRVLGVCTTTEQIGRAIAITAELGQHYDVFQVAFNDTQRALGKDPVARIHKWLAKSLVTLRQTGRDGHLQFGDSDYLGTSGILALASGVEHTAVRAAFVALFAVTRATHGHLGESAHALDLGGFDHGPRLGSIMVLDPRLARWVERDELAAVAAADPALSRLAVLPPTAITSTAAPETLAIELGDDAAQLDLATATAFATALRTALERGFVRVSGFDFRARVHATFDAPLHERGLACDAETAWRVHFKGAGHEIDARLSESTDDGRLSLSISHFDRARRPEYAPLVQSETITSRAALDLALDAALARLRNPR